MSATDTTTAPILRKHHALGPATRRAGRLLANRRLIQLELLVLWLGSWELVSHFHLLSPVLASTPLATWKAWVKILNNGTLWTNTEATLQATLIAFVLASVVGVAVGLTLGLLPRLANIVEPYVNALNSMPRIALAPLFVLYFGIGSTAKIALAFSVVVFILLVNSRAGVQSIEDDVVKLAVAMGSKRWQIFLKIFLPGAVPAIFAGLRLGLVYSLLGVVTMELVAARDGLGVLVAEYGNTFNMAGVYGILITLAIAGAILNGLMALVEAYVSRWQRAGGSARGSLLA